MSPFVLILVFTSWGWIGTRYRYAQQRDLRGGSSILQEPREKQPRRQKSRWNVASPRAHFGSGSCKQKPAQEGWHPFRTAAYHSASDALLERAPPFTWLPEVCAILYAFSQPIKQVRSALCLPGCIHRCPPSVIHCAPSHYSFVAPYLPNPRISAGGANVPFLKRHVSTIAEAPFLVPLFPTRNTTLRHFVNHLSLLSDLA